MTSLTRPTRPTATELARDPAAMDRWMEAIWDYDCLAALEEAVEEHHAAAAVRARLSEPGRYPRLQAVGKRAGCVGEARFKGRYHPRLVV